MAIPTLTDLCEGFETRSLTATTTTPVGTNHYRAISRSAGTTYVAGRRGGLALQLVEDGTTATNLQKDFTTTQTHCGALWFKITTAPVNDRSRMYTIADATPTQMFLFEIRSAGNGGIIEGLVGSTRGTGPAVCDGLWHKLEYKLVSSGTTWTLDWRIDGVALTQVTEGSHVATNMSRQFFGSGTASHNLTCQYDDFLGSVTADDFDSANWGRDWRIIGAYPNGEGTDVLGSTNPIVFTGAATGWECLDDAITVAPEESTYVTYTSTTTGDATNNYAEITFDDKVHPGMDIWQVMGFCFHFAAGTGANSMLARFVDGSNNTLTNMAGDVSETTLRGQRAIITAPGAGWPAGFDGIKCRVGLSGQGGTPDTNPLPRISALVLQYVVPDEAPPFDPNRSSKHLVRAR